MKRQVPDWEKIFAKDIFEKKWLAFRTYKDISKLNNKKTKNATNKCQKIGINPAPPNIYAQHHYLLRKYNFNSTFARTIPNIEENIKEPTFSCTARGNIKWCNHYNHSDIRWQFLIKANLYLPYDSAVLFTRFYSRKKFLFFVL